MELMFEIGFILVNKSINITLCLRTFIKRQLHKEKKIIGFQVTVVLFKITTLRYLNLQVSKTYFTMSAFHYTYNQTKC